MAVAIREVDGTELDAIVGNGRVLVDFYSKVCGPCKMLSFVLKDIAKSVDDIEMVMVDFDLNKDAIDKYGVTGYPTMIFFNNGQEIERTKGLQQKPVILRMIQS